MDSIGKTAKSFWSRPEGKTGGLVLGGIILGIGWILFQVLPTILVLLQNAIYATFLGIGLFVLIYILMDKKFQTRVGTLYRLGMRQVTGWIIEIDPIGILENHISYLRRSLDMISEKVMSLKTEVKKLETSINGNNAKREASLSKASIARQKNTKQGAKIAALETRQVGRLDSSNKRLEQLKNKMDKLYNYLRTIESKAELLVDDTENEVESRKIEYRAISAGHSAMSSAMSIIRGNHDELEMFNQAMEFVVDETSSKVGEIEYFMDMSENILDGLDIENEVFSEKGFKLLDEWENKQNIETSDSQRSNVTKFQEAEKKANTNKYTI